MPISFIKLKYLLPMCMILNIQVVSGYLRNGRCQIRLMSDNLKWLQKWYQTQCDGDWEHEFGITLKTVDNPGWYLTIDLTGTELEGIDFPYVQNLRDDKNWYFCIVRNNMFEASSDPCNLDTILYIFRQWVET